VASLIHILWHNAQGNPAAANYLQFQNPADPPLGLTALFGDFANATECPETLLPPSLTAHLPQAAVCILCGSVESGGKPKKVLPPSTANADFLNWASRCEQNVKVDARRKRT
jgi:hypothetical protein